MRFAYVAIKIGVAFLLTKYKVEKCEKTTIPLKFNPTSFTLTTKSGIWLKVRHRLQDLTEKY